MSDIQERTRPRAARTIEPPLLKTMRAYLARAEVVSFDVFDTLIVRAIAQPTDAFALVKLRLLTTDAALNSPHTIEAFPELRVQAELGARDAKERDGHPHREVTLAEIYDTFATLSGADAALIELLKQTELAVERDLVYANPVAKELFDLARAERKTVVLCSDMYLPSAEVMSLLRRCGYEGYDALYVSCEHACSKHAGTMFPYVAERHGVATGRVLHVGDNLYGDCMMAREAGCKAMYLPRPAAPDRARMPWNGEQPFYPDTVGAIVEGLSRKREHDPAHASADPWEQLGFRVFGPLFTGFLLWLAASVRERRPEKLLFLARDTHFIHQHLAAFLGVLPDELAAEYLYVSRGSLLMPSLTDFPLPRLDHLFSGKRKSSVRRHLRRLGLFPDLFVNVARSAGFVSLDELVPNGDPRMRTLLGKLHHELLRVAAKQRPLARRYLAQHIGGAKRVMMVDIGWVGNMQASMIRLLGAEHAGVEIAGHYVGVFRSAADNEYPGHTMDGWLTQRDDRPEIEQFLWWSGGVEILEFAMTAPHGTTLGYEEAPGGKVVPIIESSDTENAIGRFAARLQKGAADFVDDFISAYGSIPPEALNSRAWAGEFYRLVTDPTADEAALLGDLTHGDVAGDTSIRLSLAPAVADLDDEHDRERVAQYYWKAGFIVRNRLDDDDSFTEAAYLALYPEIREAVANGDFESGREHWLLHGQREKRVASWAAWMRSARKLLQTGK
jgi:predicted HAD superfamily hydrolase